MKVVEYGYVIKKKNEEVYHVLRDEVTNELPYAEVYENEDSAQYDLEECRDINEWEIRKIEVTYLLI